MRHSFESLMLSAAEKIKKRLTIGQNKQLTLIYVARGDSRHFFYCHSKKGVIHPEDNSNQQGAIKTVSLTSNFQ